MSILLLQLGHEISTTEKIDGEQISPGGNDKMTKKIVFMTENEVIEAVGQVTGENEATLGFCEVWELDTVKIPLHPTNEKLADFMKTLAHSEHIAKNEERIELPVNSFISAFSQLLDVELKDEVDVCECNLYEDEILYAFKIA